MPQEVTEETREAIHVLELTRTPRPEKLAAERAYFDGAHEVRFTERSFRPRHDADLDEIRAFVDSLEVRRRELPPLPPPPATIAPVVPPRIPDHYRAPLEAVIRGSLISVETVERIGTATVVDVAWESEDEGERRGLYIIDDDVARPYEAVASSIDALPPPKVEAEPAPEPEPPAPGAASAAKKEKKRLLGFGKKAKEPEPTAAAPEPAAPAEPEPQPEPVSAPEPAPKKRLLGLGRKEREPAAAPARESEPEPAPDAKKRRFGFRRGGK